MFLDKLDAMVNLAQGTFSAWIDDKRLGPNDIPELKELAKKTGVPFLDRLLDRLEQPLEKPKTLPGSAFNYAVEVVEVVPATGTLFDDATRALGAPEGAGLTAGSLDVCEAQTITLKLARKAEQYVVVFENAFHRQYVDGTLSTEVVTSDRGSVEVSEDGQTFYRLAGEAGKNAVLLNSVQRLAPWLESSGGDRFYFRDNPELPAGFKARYVRVSSTRGSVDVDAVFGA